jgi:uncharacterized C2H2 Zn-finger protein
MSEIRPAFCGTCHVPVESIADRNGEAWRACPTCGQEGREEDIFREAGEYHADKAFRGLLSSLSRGSLTVENLPQRQYRWIMGD